MDLINSKFGLISRAQCDRGKSHCGDCVMTGVDNTGRYVIMVLSDGVGSRHHDYIASQTACESFMESFLNANDMELEERFIFALKQADQDVSFPSDASHKGMMATLVAVVWDTENDKVLFDTIGDSRLYLYSNNTLKQISVDSKKAVIRRDTAGKIIKQSGVFAIQFGLTNALGYNGAKINLKTIDFKPGDSLIACSDGMYEISDFESRLTELLKTEVTDEKLSAFFEKNKSKFDDDASIIILQDNNINNDLKLKIDTIINSKTDYNNSQIATHIFSRHIKNKIDKHILRKDADGLAELLLYIVDFEIIFSEDYLLESMSKIKAIENPDKAFVHLFRVMINMLRDLKQKA